MNINKKYLLFGAVGVGAIILYNMNARKVAQAAVGLAADTATGVIYGVSDVIGLPNPNKTDCQKAKEAGDTWGASFSCGAGDFLSYLSGN